MDTRCKMRWESKALTDETAAAFKEACATFGFGPEQVHTARRLPELEIRYHYSHVKVSQAPH